VVFITLGIVAALTVCGIAIAVAMVLLSSEGF
jgi:hypothetical protein